MGGMLFRLGVDIMGEGVLVLEMLRVRLCKLIVGWRGGEVGVR